MSTKCSTLLIISFMACIFLSVVFSDWMFTNNVESSEVDEGMFFDDFWRSDGNVTQNATCLATKPCHNDNDCGFKGKCKDGNICECTCGEKGIIIIPAISFLTETLNGSPQSKCGGLKNACNETTNLCECERAYKEAGFANITDAIKNICAPAKNCTNNDDCFGMTCLPGWCECH
ncbi:hypothetical protein Mgra_00008464 [Meloidogyne graminicola]|uniref:Uncharacterized protein n=1 Tax=Meloidogyne graminicola TaxID=189291 RepID=A0A8S9ZFV3_9BILA|nr:hypothetical protein Mgra_00008464 [Meloidogyne graminicola]